MNYTEHRFPVFRTGTHIDSEGRERTWTGADLDRMAFAYDPSRHEAPVVIGHPRDNSPAYGWVRGLTHCDGTLYADADLIPEFEEIVKKGLFKKRSISLYEDGTVRHIGFLGARPPAIKGLPDIQFHEGEVTTIEFKDSKLRQGGTRMKFMDWIRQMAGKEGVTIDDLPASPHEAAYFTEAERKRENDLKAREERIRAREREALSADITSFCEALLKEGRLTPAMMTTGMGMTSFLESVASLETPIEFTDHDIGTGGEGDDKAAQTPLEFMQTLLRGLPRAVDFREIATDKDDPGAGGARSKRERLVSDFMEKNPKASYRDAVLSVSKENPELFEDR